MNETTRYNHWQVEPATKINAAISQLPKAELVNLIPEQYIAEAKKLSDYKGVRVRDHLGNVEYVQVCGSKYKEVQHEEAFRPIIEGLTVSGNKDFQFSVTSNFKKATLNIYTGGFGFDSVAIGWTIENSFDGHSKLKYGVEVNHSSKYLEFVGYRQVCKNGMKVRVPIDQAEIIKPEIVTKVKNLIADAKYEFKHEEGVLEHVKGVQYIAEALELLREPMEAMIKKSGEIKLADKKIIKQLIKQHVGKRYYSRVRDQFVNEEQDLWGLYNAITHVASHDPELTDSSRELLLDKGASMLLAEIRAE